MRLLKPDPVPQELIDQVLWAATRAPSPGNSQGWDFIVVDDAEPKTRIADAIRAAMAERVASMPRPDRTTRLMLDGTAALIDTLDRAPVIVFVAGPVIYPPAAPHERFTWSALYPAAQNIVLAARALELGSVFTTLHLTAEPTVRDVLAIPESIRIAAMIPIGWPVGTVRAGESPSGRGLRSSKRMGGRQAWRRWLSAVSVVRRRSTTTVSRPATACCVLQLRHASSSASTERPWWTSPPEPTCRPRRSTTTSAARWSCSWRRPGGSWHDLRLETHRWRGRRRTWCGRSCRRSSCSTRRLLAEIHVAAARYPEVAALLAEWHAEQAAMWVSTSGMDDDAVVKTFFALLLGLCQVESLAALPASPVVTGAVRRDARHRSLSMRSKS